MANIDFDDGVVVLPIEKWQKMEERANRYERMFRRHAEIVQALTGALMAEDGGKYPCAEDLFLRALLRGRQWYADKKVQNPVSADGRWEFVTVDPMRQCIVLKDA